MNKLFTLDITKYKAISFQSKYLYQDFSAVRSMLKNQSLDDTLTQRLLEPKLSGEFIDWYGNYSGDFKRISDLDKQFTDVILSEFHNFIQHTNGIIQKLEYSRDSDAQSWGGYFKELFNENTIILLGNSETKDWVMLWGFEFNNQKENFYVKGANMDGPKKTEELKEDEKKNEEEPPSKDLPPNIETEEENEKGEINEASRAIPIEVPGPVNPENIQGSIGCFGRIKRWLRWISYRFWGLFWLLIYTLLIIWLCKYCDRPNCDAYCEKLKKTKEELKRLEERVRERCDTTYVKPR